MEEQILYNLRKDYSPVPLIPEKLSKDPFIQFGRWFDDALANEHQEANAMIVSTCGISGKISSRVVLLKSFSKKHFVFFTNYNSKKGKEIEDNPNIALLFFWPVTMRQIRIEGVAEKSTLEISAKYFRNRPRESQASSALSRQSEPLTNKPGFEKAVKELASGNADIEKPLHWGGYSVTPHSFEFWQGGTGRSHDRFLYELTGDKWIIKQLYP